jgi:hypothetical protein
LVVVPLDGDRISSGLRQMSDIVDDAQAVEALELAINLAKARRPRSTLLACGSCYNCEAITPDGALFCDADCRDDYQLRATRSAHQ